jgi:DNA repair exonuclease SbcCD nuclease subunit
MASIDDHGYNTRLVDSINRLDRIVNQMEYDILLFCGDMFHDGSRLHPRTLKLFRDTMGCGRQADVINKRIFIPGQHDWCDPGSFSALTALKDGMFRLFESPSRHKIGDLNFIFCPNYRSTDKQLSMLNDCNAFFDEGAYNIFVGHFLVREIMEENRDPVIPPNAISLEDLPDYDFAFMGDYHPHVFLESEGIVSVGAVQHHSFNDKNRKQGNIIVFDTKKEDVQPIEMTSAPMFVEVSASDLGKRIKERPNDYYKVIVDSDERAKEIKNKFGDYHIRYDYSKNDGPKALSADREGWSYSDSPKDLVGRYCEKYDPNMVGSGLKILEEVGLCSGSQNSR